ncbi:uncharacterized protein LOC143070758 [Mytilus galloprovincialis]|uniref:uncharacterized protein LOC143070758 n=1 Tax=Mytilus galloprovincialis TaxID=29158 RepID=UPI003F7B8210
MVTQNKIKSLDVKMKSMGELKAVQQVQELTDLKDKVHTIESQTHSLAVHEQARSQDFLALYNHTIELGKKISVNSQQVAFTSCATDAGYGSGSIIKFQNVKYQVGFSNGSVFTSTGKFKASLQGLYHVSVSIVSDTLDGTFDIYRNGRTISHNFISRSGVYEMATAVVAHQLHINDIVWVQASSSNLAVDSEGSCLTIIKIK